MVADLYQFSRTEYLPQPNHQEYRLRTVREVGLKLRLRFRWKPPPWSGNQNQDDVTNLLYPKDATR
jgi:hypothetical protein